MKMMNIMEGEIFTFLVLRLHFAFSKGNSCDGLSVSRVGNT